MNTPNSFFIDLLAIMPERFDCYIQAPSLENQVIDGMLIESELDYYKLLRVNELNFKAIVQEETLTHFSMYVQSIRIVSGGSVLFEGFDGIEFGTISKEFNIPVWFRTNYIPHTCFISGEW